MLLEFLYKNTSICGYRIICILSDNNVVNRKKCLILNGTNCLVSHINNPINPDHKIYLFYDIVHLLKCIRNNWIIDTEKILTYHNICDNDLIMHASFCNLITIYHMEKELILKEGF